MSNLEMLDEESGLTGDVQGRFDEIVDPLMGLAMIGGISG